ncbi:ribosome biogenesis GTPase Der [Granulosicoccus antarcticus]|uniref:GTPase Der n=1 Tax=Granulosicoccus antarcticus IMCC3135 TaxID=1192854 RepID=A0A2Z2NU99_9GAMM|nr:ribosome biogenesis GTPase Der [Granulosicoccus antarcticus]ASJ74879.1 GTPase Der [Granulosicoccus antarcticus IMCC3135]
MKPTIALVGRPNVGKSTLFNKLTRTQDALVADMPGLTRDRQYGDGKVGGWPYLLVDTGGLSGAPDSLDAAMADQTLCAVREADLVVFMVDGRSGIVSVDEEIADILRRHARHVMLCVNKIDGIGEDKAQLDFHQLGFDNMVSIAASHNRGVQQLIEEIGDYFEIPQEERIEPSRKRRSRKNKVVDKSAEPGSEGASVEGGEPGFGPGYEPVEQSEIRITFVGRPNVGKSTLINRLLGEDRVIAYDQPGTTRDSVSVPFERAGREYSLIDTAGVRRRGKVSEAVEIFSIIKTLQSIDKSNVCVMLLDGTDGITDQDLSLLGYIIDKGRALIVAVNKWDSLNEKQREAMREELERRVEFLKFTRIHFISALQGSGVGDLFKSINKAYASAFVDMSTPHLTRMLEIVTTQHQPPMVNGRRIKLRYAHQGGQNPPIIVIHGKQALKVPQSYQRYLMNHFTKALKLFGTPLRIEFRQDDNPYTETTRVRPVKDKGDAKRRRDKRDGKEQAPVAGRDGRGKKIAAKKVGKKVAKKKTSGKRDVKRSSRNDAATGKR